MSDNEQKKKIGRKPSTADDRRTTRTRRALKQSAADLIHSMRYEDITVQNILDRADVGRSTFYAHFTDKDDLVRQMFEEMLESITSGVEPGKGGAPAFPLAGLFRRLKDQLAARGVWQSDRGREYLFSIGQAYWAGRIERELTRRRGKRGAPDVPIPLIALMATSAATALLTWWIKNKMPYSPEEMEAMFDRVMTPGIKAVCG
ncbi:MAG: TetR/AcrR family transcriptional regulator [Anaerolineales bacterium]|nr:TetR/AcrR family transcriptional regulator [Anaerolineales bacterium]